MLISVPMSSVTLFSPDPHQAKTHPRILIEDSQLPLAQCPKIIGVYLDTSLSFKKHSGYVGRELCSRESIQYKPYHQGLGRYILGTTAGDITDDLQGSWEINHQLCCTYLEYKPTRHKLQKHPINTERGSEDCHWLSQDVQCQPPTCRS